jgi:hypothetical protein
MMKIKCRYGDARPKENKRGWVNAGDRQRQQRKQSAAYDDDDGDF